MVDSVSVVIGGEATAWLSVLPVVPDALEGAAAVAFERELALGRFDDRFDPLADPAQVAVPVGLVFTVGAEEPGGELADDLFELLAGEPFVADDELVTFKGAVVAHPVEERCGDLALGLVGRGEAEA